MSEQKMLDGVEHFGSLLQRLRLTAKLRQEDVPNVDSATISKFENNRAKISHPSFSQYVRILRRKSELTQEDEDLLERMYRDSGYEAESDITDHHDRLARYKFALLETATPDRDHPEQTELAELREALLNETRPAYIRDELWFIHAYNQQFLDLIGLTLPDLKDSWTSWHIIGSLFASNSKLRHAFGPNEQLYLPQATDQFFKETVDIFFTAYMKALRNRLWKLSPLYRRYWRDALSFQRPPHENTDYSMNICYKGKEVHFKVLSENKKIIAHSHILRYVKNVWNPEGNKGAKRAVESINKRLSEQKIHFAAKNISDYHGWQDVEQFLAEAKNRTLSGVTRRAGTK